MRPAAETERMSEMLIRQGTWQNTASTARCLRISGRLNVDITTVKCHSTGHVIDAHFGIFTARHICVAQYMPWPVSVCASRRYCIETSERIELFFGTDVTLCLLGNSTISKNKGTPFWSFSQTLNLANFSAYFRHSTPRSLVYHTERPLMFTTRWPWRGALHGLFVIAETTTYKYFYHCLSKFKDDMQWFLVVKVNCP